MAGERRGSALPQAVQAAAAAELPASYLIKLVSGSVGLHTYLGIVRDLSEDSLSPLISQDGDAYRGSAVLSTVCS